MADEDDGEECDCGVSIESRGEITDVYRCRECMGCFLSLHQFYLHFQIYEHQQVEVDNFVSIHEIRSCIAALSSSEEENQNRTEQEVDARQSNNNSNEPVLDSLNNNSNNEDKTEQHEEMDVSDSATEGSVGGRDIEPSVNRKDSLDSNATIEDKNQGNMEVGMSNNDAESSVGGESPKSSTLSTASTVSYVSPNNPNVAEQVNSIAKPPMRVCKRNRPGPACVKQKWKNRKENVKELEEKVVSSTSNLCQDSTPTENIEVMDDVSTISGESEAVSNSTEDIRSASTTSQRPIDERIKIKQEAFEKSELKNGGAVAKKNGESSENNGTGQSYFCLWCKVKFSDLNLLKSHAITHIASQSLK